MTKNSLKETIRHRRLVGDGAMGTELMRAGLEHGGCGEAWNLHFPERIVEIQRRYVEAGSDCLITNTFGGNRIMLERHGAADRVDAINHASVELARRAFGDKEGYVLGDIGPFGGVMEPYGDVPEDDVRQAFQEQAASLVDGGADAIIIETQTGCNELGLAIQASREANAPCIIASFAFDSSPDGSFFRTMMGISPEEAVKFIQEQGADIAAFNCGTGIDMVNAAEIIRLYRFSCDLPIMVQPNAGQPVLEDFRAVYKQTPAEMAKGVPGVLAAGANIVGACCGSSPEHIRSIRALVDEFNSKQSAK